MPYWVFEHDEAVATSEFSRKELEKIINTYYAIGKRALDFIYLSCNKEFFVLRSEYMVTNLAVEQV